MSSNKRASAIDSNPESACSGPVDPRKVLYFVASTHCLFHWFLGAVSWTCEIFATGAPIDFKVFSAAFVIVGFYLAFGRFLIDAHFRHQSHYAITDRRVLVVGGLAGKDIASFSRRSHQKVSVRETVGDRATIQFGDTWPLPRWHSTYWRNPEFFRTRNAHAALELLRNGAGA